MAFESLAAQSHALEARLGTPPLIRLVGKRPIDLAWTQAGRETPDNVRALLDTWTGNVGLLTGRTAFGRYLVVVDADLKRDGAQGSLDALYALGLPRHTVTTITGGGGLHLYYLTRYPIPSRPLEGFPGIDLKCVGGMVVVPWSIHPDTLVPYEWEYGYSPEEVDVAELPDDLAALFGGGHESGWKPSARQAADTDEAADLETLALLEQWFGAVGSHRQGDHYETTRPGKETGTSATVGVVGPGVVHVFTSNWPDLPAGTYNARELRARKGIPDPVSARLAAAIPTREREPRAFVQSATIRTRRQEWLWNGMVPAGHFMLAAGREELGKSAACLWLAARATRGELDGDLKGEPTTVLYCSTEDDADRVLKPRALAAGADHERLWFLDPMGAGFSLDAMADLHPRLLILDPISSFLALPAHNENGEHVVRAALAPLIAYALDHDATVIGVRHLRKGGGNESVYDAILGARAWSAAPRAHLMFAPDNERGAGHGLLFPRGNLSRGGVVHRYRLDNEQVALDAGGWASVPLFVLEAEAAAVDLEAALRPSTGPRESAGPNGVLAAQAWLIEALSEGPMLATALNAEAAENGIARRTLERARSGLGVQAERRTDDHGERSWWAFLPDLDRRPPPPMGVAPYDETDVYGDTATPIGGGGLPQGLLDMAADRPEYEKP